MATSHKNTVYGRYRTFELNFHPPIERSTLKVSLVPKKMLINSANEMKRKAH